jgi:hypothetical protein
MRRAYDPPTLGALFEGTLPWIAGLAVLLPMFPGFLLCIPGLVLAGVVVIPVIAAALVAGVVAGVVEMVLVLGRRAADVTVRRWLRPVVERAPRERRRAVRGLRASRPQPRR